MAFLMALSDNMKGAVFMMASMAAFVVNDAMMKSLAGEVPLFQAILIRGLFATALVAVLAARAGVLRVSALAPADRWPAAIRIVAEVGVTACFLSALFSMPLANATAILQSTPLALTFAAAIFLREPVGWRRWMAVAVGFAGVLLIVRPGAAGFGAPALYALAAVVFVVIRDLVTKRLTDTSSLFITLTTALAITLLGAGVSATREWVPVDAAAVGVMAAAACFLFVGYLCAVLTMRVGEMSFVSPFRYTILLWALILGWAVFGEVPTGLTLLGAAIVAGAGLFTFYRERRVNAAG